MIPFWTPTASNGIDFFMAKIILETKRLVLREFVPSDVGNLREILSDPIVMKFSPMGPLNKEQLEENLAFTIAKYAETGAGFWGGS